MVEVGRDDLTGAFKSRKGQYAGAILRTVAVEEAGKMVLVRGAMEFAVERIEPEDLDYGDLRFQKFWMQLDEAYAFLQSLCNNETPANFNFPIHGAVKIQAPRWAEGDLPDPIGSGARVTDWPASMFLLKIPSAGTLPHRPVVRKGLPIISDARERSNQWCGLVDRLGDAHDAIVVTFPDYRGRIRDVAVDDEALIITTDSLVGDTHDYDIRVSVYGDHWSESPVSRAEGRFVASIDGIPSQVQLFLVDRSSGEMIDWARFSPGYGDLPPNVSYVIPEQRILNLIANGEGEKLEFKQEVNGWFGIIQSIVAFANTEGGKILVGIADDGTIVGTEVEKVRPRIQEWTERFCDPPIDLQYSVVKLLDHHVLVVDVPMGKNRPHVMREKGVIYVRRGATDRPINRAELDQLYERHPVRTGGLASRL